MGTNLSRLLLSLALLLLPLTIRAASPPQSQPEQNSITLPGCPDKCGNITVPYPFGFQPGCYRDSSFNLTCNYSHNPPRLSISSYGYQIIDVSLQTSEARVYLEVSRACFSSGTSNILTSDLRYGDLLGTSFFFSAARNWFIAVGCPNLGYFVDVEGYYVSGCMSACRPSQYELLDGSCTGVGCCQSTIPSGLYYYEPYINNFGNATQRSTGTADPIFFANSTNCSYVFLADSDWFNFTKSYLSRTDNFQVPVVLDWAVRDVDNCSYAKRNVTNYACRSANSACISSGNGAGYGCNCTDGYEGNPYILGGCQDINECELKENYSCYWDCTNTPGSYICSCPSGYTGDPKIKDGCRSKDKFTLALKVVTGVSVGVFLVAFMLFWLYLGMQKRKLIKAKQRFFEQNGGVLLQQQMRSFNSTSFRIYSEEELDKATNNFDTERVLGRGGHGIVYKGILEGGTVVAIKKSKIMEEHQTKEFAKEMLILSQINHKNVVKLLGCCLEVEVPMLVYEFIAYGTLYHYIHDKNFKSCIPSDVRLRIASESAEALAYMHSSASPPILHGDVKSANILLDENLTAKVSDFGASKLAPNDEAEIATLVQGTCGYLDPEYLLTCQLTDRSDVYSFGVIILELLTRKKALYFEGSEEDRSLASYFLTAVKERRYIEILDGQVREELRIEVLEEIGDLVMKCLSMNREERPTMKEVAERLERARRFQKQQLIQENINQVETHSLLGQSFDIYAGENSMSYGLAEEAIRDIEDGRRRF